MLWTLQKYIMTIVIHVADGKLYGRQKLDKELNNKIEYEIEKYSRKVESIVEKQNKDLLRE